MLKMTRLLASVAIEKSAVLSSSDTPTGKKQSTSPSCNEPEMYCWEESTVRSVSAASFRRAKFPYSINDSELADVTMLLPEKRVCPDRAFWPLIFTVPTIFIIHIDDSRCRVDTAATIVTLNSDFAIVRAM